MDSPELAPAVDVTAAPMNEPATHLVGSALVAALAFLPTGVVAVLCSLRVRSWNARGDYSRARRYSRASLALIVVSVIFGVATYAVIVLGLLALGAFSGG